MFVFSFIYIGFCFGFGVFYFEILLYRLLLGFLLIKILVLFGFFRVVDLMLSLNSNVF